MIYKYYSCNIIKGTFGVVGSRVIRVYFFCSPYAAYSTIDKTLSKDLAIIDFKRIK